MAIYHLSVKNIGRGHGRSAVACAAYRAGSRIADERRGSVADYRRKSGVVLSEIVLPAGAPAWMGDRAKLWNAVEQAEKRKDARLAKEIVVALPHELTDDERAGLARSFALALAGQGMVADLNIHRPHREGDARNHHAHIMLTTRDIAGDGFGKKMRALDQKAFVHVVRELWAGLVNEVLADGGHAVRVDHRSLNEQGIERIPQIKEGPKVRVIVRKKRRLPPSRVRKVRASRQGRAREVDYRKIDRGRSRAERNEEIRQLNRERATRERDIRQPSWKRRATEPPFPYLERDRVRDLPSRNR